MLKIQKYIKNAKIPLISALKKQLHDNPGHKSAEFILLQLVARTYLVITLSLTAIVIP